MKTLFPKNTRVQINHRLKFLTSNFAGDPDLKALLFAVIRVFNS